MLRAGSARVRITPPLGTLLAGNAGLRREATGIHDHLNASAIVLSDSDDTVALVSCDVIGVDAHTTRRIRSLVAEETDIPPENVMITATHTHTGPQTVRVFRDRDETYVDHFEKQVASSIRLAYNDLSPAQASAAQGEEPTLSHNRRIITGDGDVLLPTQDFDPNRVLGAEGPTDPTLNTLTIANESQVQAILVNYTTHTDLVTGYKVSADFPGYLTEALQGIYGEDLVVPYLPGAAGNVSSFDPSKEYPSRSHYIDPQGLRRAREAGRVLAGSTLRTVEPARTDATDDIHVSAANQTISVETRRPEEERLRDAESVVNDSDAPLRDHVLARSVLSFAEYQADHSTVDIEVQAIRVGDTTIVGLPGEPFVDFGLRIREQLPGPTFVAGYTNNLVGYIPTPEAFENGGYETTAGWVSRFTPSTGDELATAAIELGQSLSPT